ncbi:MAG: energy transducer TonB [Crocinitomicaceae bacterium]
MRLVLVFFGLLFTFSVNALSMTVSVIDGCNSSSVPNCSVIIRSNVGRFLEERKTDSLGKVVFSDLTYGYHTIEADSIPGDFFGEVHRFKLQRSTNITLTLEPTQNFKRLERSKWALLDEKYDKINEALASDSTLSADQEITDTLTSNASFPGGKQKMNQFLREKVIYPEICLELGEQGIVYVECIIQRDGTLTHVKVIHGISRGLDFEATRLLRSMPKWEPQITKGKAVRVKCRIPVIFTLQ